MEWVFYLSGVSSGAVLVLVSGVLILLYKTRGFRIRLGVVNADEPEPAPLTRAKPKDDYDLSREPVDEPVPR
jgi:hypothetical protein